MTREIEATISEISRPSAVRARLLRAAGRILSPDEAEDALQDGIVQVLTSGGEFRGDAQPGTWMYRVVVNAALMRRRKNGRAERLESLREQPEARSWAAGGAPLPIPDRQAESREELARAQEAVAALSDEYRAVIERCVLQERDAEEVAGELGITPACLRTRASRARQRLQSALAA